ncbi:hypothetical protein ZIOFF_076168 [Zingiber officinale]|uniref:Serine-threonine kinase receptor-associated protein n=1 Tax=Zingiber officinale TaxID=94328 RepID=A0A8J5BVZ5_ZINOF|nr:hypothetical protein ZIOFF_076168 [Zingiber officinale]
MEKKKVAVPLVCHGHSRPVVDLFYSPVTPDGFFLFSASKDANPMLRNGETGDWIGTFEGHKGAVWSCCLDTNALRAATGSADFSALRGSTKTLLQEDEANRITEVGTAEALFESGRTNRRFGKEDLPNQATAAVQFKKNKGLLELIMEHKGEGKPSYIDFTTAITEQGQEAHCKPCCEKRKRNGITWGGTAKALLENGRTKEVIGGEQTCEGQRRHSERWGASVASQREEIVKVWDALTGNELHSFEHKHIVRACAFSEDMHLLLTGGMEKILRTFDLNRPDAPPREIDKSPGSIRTVDWLHSDQTILSSCTDMGGVRLWDIRSGKIVQTLETKSPVTSAEVSQDGRYITTADGSTVKFWDANHFGLVKNYDMPCTVESASLEPKYGNKFVVGGEDMWIHVFDFHTGEEIVCNKGHHGPVHCVRFSPGGESYASGSEDGTIRIWQMGPVADDNDSYSTNTPPGKQKVGADEVAHKIESFHITKDELRE